LILTPRPLRLCEKKIIVFITIMPLQDRKTENTIFTIGHSTRPLDEFIDMVKAHGVQLVADVRTIPRSRHNPQFNGDALAKSLKASAIDYVHMPGLGGLRHARKDSVNQGWENASFRGFADYMQSEEFEEGLQKLIEAAKTQKTAIMCAEAVPWKCHRSLIGDALFTRGIAVMDIMSPTSAKPHVLTAWAEVSGTKVIYPKK
jgi:uncharacterized protein (DUF488 family)